MERKRQLLTMERLAEMVGITENFLGKIERGDSTPSLPTMDSIADALGVSMDQLMHGQQQNAEYQFIKSLMEVNGLTRESKERFIDFINTNIKYFK